MFKGNYLHTIDAKGRLSIPARLRKEFSAAADNTIVLIPGKNSCVEMFTKDRWAEVEEKVMQLNSNNQEARLFLRMLMNNAHEDQMDPQYRILIPANFLKKAQIGNEVLIVGSGKTIELWNPSAYDAYINSSQKTFEELAEQFFGSL